MKRWILEIVALVLCFVLGVLVASLVATKCCKPREVIEIQRDTIVKVDTFYKEKPVPVVKWKEKRDTILIAVAKTDTLVVGDTLFLPQPREFAIYSDSTYKAQVSGIKPQLDWIEVYAKTKTITIRQMEEQSRFGVSVQAGFGTTYGLVGKKVDVGPYIGVGIHYNLLTPKARQKRK